MRYIHEARMGDAKSFKTGAVVGTYPKPMLVLCLDRGGLEVIPPRGTKPGKDQIQLDICQEDIVWVTKEKSLADWAKLPTADQPKVLAVDYFSVRAGAKLNDLYQPAGNKAGYAGFIRDINLVIENCPWATVVIDPITGLNELIHMHVAATCNADAKVMEDARKWAPRIGFQIQKVITQLQDMQAHTVCILHSDAVVAEGGQISEYRPMIPSKYGRDRVKGIVSQFLFATKVNGKPRIWTSDKSYAKGLGCRWPHNLPVEVAPTYTAIYETTY